MEKHVKKIEELVKNIAHIRNEVSEELTCITKEYTGTYWNLEQKKVEVNDLEKSITKLKRHIEDLKTEIEDLKFIKDAWIEEAQENFTIEEFIPPHHRNIVMVAALESLLQNLDHVTAEEVDNLSKTPSY